MIEYGVSEILWIMKAIIHTARSPERGLEAVLLMTCTSQPGSTTRAFKDSLEIEELQLLGYDG
jgi:hypothetical protein